MGERRRRLAAVALVVALVVLVGTVAAAGFADLRSNDVRFEVVGTEIRGPDGDRFVPLGMNLLGPDAFFNDDGATAGHAEVVRHVWNLNTVRLNACLPEGCPYTGVHNQRNDGLDALVEEYTGEGLVVMLALHQIEPGSWPDDDELDDIEEWWRSMARRFRSNQRVWFNVLNEPGSDKPVPERWLTLHERLIRAIRGEGADNLIVVDGTQWGQEAGGVEQGEVPDENSAILTFGDELKEVDDQVVFSFHVYDQWGHPGGTDAERDARLDDFIERVHDAGHAVLIGEVGGAEEQCCEPAALGGATAFRVAPRRGVGLIAWHGQGVDGNRLVDVDAEATDPSMIDGGRPPSNLTWQGRLLWELAHR